MNQLSDCVANGDLIATEPFPKRSEVGAPAPSAPRAPVPGRAARVGTAGGQGEILIPLHVLVGNAAIRSGDTVYVRAEDVAQQWAHPLKRQGDTVEFIMVPIRNVLLIEHRPA